MGLYNFQKRFVPFILSGEKKHTIRSIRKNPDKPGNILHLYTGLRTKKAKLIKRVECARIEEITIDRWMVKSPTPYLIIEIDGQRLSDDEAKHFAKLDGFPDIWEMERFWRRYHKLPFKGHVIYWK